MGGKGRGDGDGDVDDGDGDDHVDGSVEEMAAAAGHHVEGPGKGT